MQKLNRVQTKVIAIIFVTLATIFWGTNFNVGKVVIEQIAPVTAAAIRFCLSSLFILPLLLLLESKVAIKAAVKQNFWMYILLGMIGIAGYNGLFFVGLQYTTSINAALIMATNPIFTLILAAWFLKDQIQNYQRIGLLVSFIGVLTVITHGSFDELVHLKIALGDVIIMVANILWALYSVLGRRYLQNSSPLITTAMTMFVGSIILILFVGVNVDILNIVQQSWRVYLSLIYMALFGSVLAYLFWNYGIKHLGAGTTATFFNLVPIVTMCVSLYIGQAITSVQIVGGVAVIFGVLISTNMISVVWTNRAINSPQQVSEELH